RLPIRCATFAAAMILGAAALAQPADPPPVAVTPSEMSWIPQGSLAAPGMEQLNLVGNPLKPGPYTLRLKFPKGLRLAPHAHPDYREVTILSGVWNTGSGAKFDESRITPL